MTSTQHLNLPFIASGQAQKHVTVNAAFDMLDALVQLSVASASLSDPPVAPDEGDRYVIPDTPTAEWLDQAGRIAHWRAGAWAFYTPRPGWRAYVEDTEATLIYNGVAWVDQAASLLNSAEKVGVNTLADAANRLAVKSDAVLFSHDDVTPGNGGVQHKLNKAAADKTASVLFQQSWSGRAEIGLTGNDDLSIKVSPDGANWTQALAVDAVTGEVTLPVGRRHPVTGQPLLGLQPTPGADGEVTIWRFDAARSGLPRHATINSVSGDKITLIEAVSNQFFTTSIMENVSYIRIWNASKSPEQQAWLRSAGNSFELFVVDPASVAGWSSGDQIRLGEPGPGPVEGTVAVDVSPMLRNRLGAEFRQSGLLAKVTAAGDGVRGDLGVSADGSGGSFGNVFSGNDGGISSATLMIPCSQISPISNSNLFHLREKSHADNTLTVGAVTCQAVIG